MDQARRPATDDSHWATKSVGRTIWLRIGMFAPFFSFAFLLGSLLTFLFLSLLAFLSCGYVLFHNEIGRAHV